MKPGHIIACLWLLLAPVPALSFPVHWDPEEFNGFDVNGGLIDPVDIYPAGVPRDGIPAINAPQFLAGPARNGALNAGDRVLAISYNGVAKAYPIRILDYHEIVNDVFNGRPVAITFCPLCGTGMAFGADVEGERLVLGVSGLLYNSDALFYDQATGSLWSQIMMTAVTGPRMGRKLIQLPTRQTTWGAWLHDHPDSLLLSTDTGHQRDYSVDAYEMYRRTPAVMFPTTHQDMRIPARHWVVGIVIGDEAIALPFEQLDRVDSDLELTLGDKPLRVHWDRESSSARVVDGEGREIPSTAAYWFAWVAFHPDTGLYIAPQD